MQKSRHAISQKSIWGCSALKVAVLCVLCNFYGVCLAQPSPDCTQGPCVKIGLADDNHGGTWKHWGLQSYLVHCNVNSTTEVSVLSRLTNGLYICTGCSHGGSLVDLECFRGE